MSVPLPAPGRVEPVQRFDVSNADAALRVLQRGFPDRDAAFWRAGSARWHALSAKSEQAKSDQAKSDQSKSDRSSTLEGYLLGQAGEEVGVLLTFPSHRIRRDGSAYETVNLSSWYVDPDHRWRAPAMLRGVLREQTTVFTDLTPSPGVERLNAALGFRLWSDGTLYAAALPWAAKRAGNEAAILDLDGPGAGGLGAEERVMLLRHANVGCLPAILEHPDGVAALLFRLTWRRGVRVAQLLYAESRRLVLENLPLIMRFLLRRGVLLLAIDATRSLHIPGTVFRPGAKRFTKGRLDEDRLDYAYSELVALGV